MLNDFSLRLAGLAHAACSTGMQVLTLAKEREDEPSDSNMILKPSSWLTIRFNDYMNSFNLTFLKVVFASTYIRNVVPHTL